MSGEAGDHETGGMNRGSVVMARRSNGEECPPQRCRNDLGNELMRLRSTPARIRSSTGKQSLRHSACREEYQTGRIVALSAN